MKIWLIFYLGGHGIVINIHGCQPNPRNGHLCTKIAQKLKLLSGTVCNFNAMSCFELLSIMFRISDL